MRLAKYLARAGVASRRRAEEIIFHGRVRVNGFIEKFPQADVDEKDSITVDGKLIGGLEEKAYLLLNKPAGYISTVSDTHDRPTVTSLVKDFKMRLYPVGRLDADTTGTLLLTNDGQLSYRLTHPSYGVKKVYLATVKGLPSREALEKLSDGVIIDREKTAPAEVRVLQRSRAQNRAELEITLKEGKKRQVKRICAAVGYPVITLQRRSFGGIEAGNLQEGEYRHLTPEEVRDLYRLVGL